MYKRQIQWCIKLNETNSTYLVNHEIIPNENLAMYLSMILDAKLRWKEHVKKKCEELEIKFKKL